MKGNKVLPGRVPQRGEAPGQSGGVLKPAVSKKRRQNAAGTQKVALIALSVLAAALFAFFLVLKFRPAAAAPKERIPHAAKTVAADPGESFLELHPEYEGTLLLKTEDAGDAYIEETLFIGDSNTARYSLFGLLPLANTMGIEGIGIQSVTAHPGIYWSGYDSPTTIIRGIGMAQPRRIVSCFGTNNLAYKDAETFAEQYGEMLDVLEEEYPYADIIIMSVHPLGTNCGASLSPATVAEYNDALMQMTRERGLRYLNAYEVLADKNGAMKSEYIISDGIHLAESALERVLEYVRTHAWTGTEDRRPKPLEDVPGRRPAPYVPPKEEEEEEPEAEFSPQTAASYAAAYLANDGFTFASGTVDYKTAVDSRSFHYPIAGTAAGMEGAVAGEVHMAIKSAFGRGVIAVGGSISGSNYVISVFLFSGGTASPTPGGTPSATPAPPPATVSPSPSVTPPPSEVVTPPPATPTPSSSSAPPTDTVSPSPSVTPPPSEVVTPPPDAPSPVAPPSSDPAV